jgi:hypothetical protein
MNNTETVPGNFCNKCQTRRGTEATCGLEIGADKLLVVFVVDRIANLTAPST